jgi:hypothetical protein
MSSLPTASLLDRAWNDVLAWLPTDIDELAKQTGAIQKPRQIRTGRQLLRLVFAYSVLDLSLRSTSAWAKTQKIAKMSDVAIYKRLSAAVDFLACILARLLAKKVPASQVGPLPWRVRIIDATTVSAPGSSGTDWRIHATYDPVLGTFDTIELTDDSGGEHFGRTNGGEGELILGDRGYAHSTRIFEARRAGAHVLVRVGHSAVPMWNLDGNRLDPLAWARRKRSKAGRPSRVEEAMIVLGNDGEECCLGRLIVIRKSVAATERERARIRKECGRKGKTPTERSLAAAAFTFLVTTVPKKEASAVMLSELYRVRWQVELAFKRWKSLMKLSDLRAREPGLARAYILGKLIAALLSDTLSRTARDISPWGVPIGATAESLEVVPVGH